MAKSYLAHDGDIAEVLQTLFHSPESWSHDTYRAKVKTPIEFIASAIRASGANIDNMQPLVNALRDMGMPVYGAVPPTGYKWDASNWVSTGALVNRMNFALNFAANRLPGVSSAFTAPSQSTFTVEDGSGPRSAAPATATTGNLPTPEAEELRLESELVAGGISVPTRSAVLDQFHQQSLTVQIQLPPRTMQASVNPVQAAKNLEKQDQLLAGLLLGSPEFQRR